MSVALQTRFTPEDLLIMPGGSRHELVDGKLVELNSSDFCSFVAHRIYCLLRSYSNDHWPAWVLPEGTTYSCFPNSPCTVRKADVSVLRLERLTANEAQTIGHMLIAPDLVVIVSSPWDLVYGLDKKIHDFLAAGVTLVWEVNPKLHTVVVHRRDGTGICLDETDEITGESVLPGFSCRVSEFFRLTTT